MARSSIVRTTRRLSAAVTGSAELVEQRGAVVTGGGLRHVEGHDDRAVWVGLENVQDHRIVPLRLVAEARRDIREYISHVVARRAVRVVAEATADEHRADAVLEREAVGKFPVHERARRQRPADRDR